MSPSRKEQRHERILASLGANPALRVNQLADELSVSTETIRRDLTELQQVGRISRTYGGAVSASNRFEPVLNERMGLHVAERRAIARHAALLYAREEALILGGGATMLHFARALREVAHRMTVITPSYPVAAELSQNPAIEVMALPGLFEPQEHIVYGPETLRAIARYAVPRAILGASGVNEAGISEALLNAGEIYSAIMQHADHSVILADQSKFDKRALVLLEGWSADMTLISDQPPRGALASSLKSCRTHVVISTPEQAAGPGAG